MNKFKITFVLASFIFVAGCSEGTSTNSNKSNEDLAIAWVEAGYTGKTEAIEMVTKNIAEDAEVLRLRCLANLTSQRLRWVGGSASSFSSLRDRRWRRRCEASGWPLSTHT